MADRQPISKKIRFEVFKRDSFTCQYCGRMAPDVVLELDHINPVAENGNNDFINIITSCFDCNRGKGKRKLSDRDEVKKQQEQLKQLNKKREQMRMLLEWKNELSLFEDEQVCEIEKILKTSTQFGFSDFGRNDCKKLIKKYSFEEVLESTKISISQYYEEKNRDSVTKVFNYISRICICRAKSKERPELNKINYIVAICKNRFGYYNDWWLRKFLVEHMEEKDIESLIYLAKTAYNKSDFDNAVAEYFGD